MEFKDRAREGRPSGPEAHGTLYPPRSSGFGVADRMREHCQPPFGAGFGTATRDGDSLGAGCQPDAFGESIVDGKHAAFAHLWNTCTRDRRLLEECDPEHRSRGSSAAQ